MSFYDAIRVGAAGAGDFEVERSLRFAEVDPNYLSRNFQSGGNRKKWTFSAWIKRGALGNIAGEQRIFGGSTNASHIFFTSNDALTWDVAAPGSSASANLTTSQLFRDPSAWYHLVCAFDTDNSTADNRMRIYINGTEVTSFGTRTNPSSGYALNAINADAFADGDRSLHTIGYRTSVQGSAGMEFDGYMAEINFIDGQQYDPSYFGETKATTGQWNPKQYDGTYGTTGFYLKFSDNSGTTATTLGKDSSGNGNNWTPNNFTVSAGYQNDSLEDTPTLNYPVMNNLDIGTTNDQQMKFINANLQIKANSGVWASVRGTFAVSSGKWYWEVDCLLNASLRPFIGIIESKVRLASNQTETSNELGPSSTGIAYQTGFQLIRGGTNTSGTNVGGTVPSTSNGDIVGVALDMDNKKVFFSKNGTFFASQDPANSTGEIVSFSTTMQNATIAPAIQVYDNSSETAINFGQRAFSYTPPTGYKKLNSANLSDPSILLGNKYFDIKLWTGNGSSQDITGFNFAPDWIWGKPRSVAHFHNLVDTVRGKTNQVFSNSNTNEETGATAITAFLSNGFTVGSQGNALNNNNETYVGWCWDAGETDSATYRVVVVSDSGNKYRFRNSANSATFAQSAVTLALAEGGTYTFDQSDSTMSSHPMKLSTTANGTHGGGSSYNTGVTYELDGSTVTESAFVSGFSSATSRKLIITVAASAPTLYYYCHYHSGMGGTADTFDTLGSSNFDGSVQSVVKASTTAGFSIVRWTIPSNAVYTVGHGLGVAPKVIFMKARNGTTNWDVFHIEAGNTKRLQLNATDAQQDYTGPWNDTDPTSTVFTSTGSWLNGANINVIAYVFSEVAGYSKFGKYTGNGSTHGTFVFTGFKPAFLLIKRLDSASEWSLFDTTRKTFNVGDLRLEPNSSSTEDSNSVNYHDILSNGFKMRNSDAARNGSGATYIYLAFAESPFKNSRAR